MGTVIAFATLAIMQGVSTPTVPVSPPALTAPASAAITPSPQRCDPRPWQRLVGRTVSDLLTISLPTGSRIYRVDDPPLKSVAPGRLSIEINRSTRVRRVYCS